MLSNPDRRRGARRRGTVAVLTAICLVAVVSVMALALDGGLLLGQRRQAQGVADAAAHAAACNLYTNEATYNGLDPLGKAAAAALSNASANGYDNDGSTNKVTVNIPPKSGNFSGQPGYAEVIVQLNQARMFSGIFGSGTIPVTARAVARGTSAPYSTASMIVLDPSSAGAFTASGSGHVISTSTIQVNSTNVAAVNANNSGYLKAPTILIGGNYTTSGSGYLSGTIGTSARSVSDPLASIAEPDPSGMTTRGSIPTYGSYTMSPGVYNGGVTIGGGMNVTMSPGVYYMKSGGFNIGNGATVVGNGVTIYVDNGGGQFSFQGGGNITLSAPTSGPYTGIVMFQDRTSTKPISIANGSTSAITGTVYAASAPLVIAGGASASQFGSQFVTKTVNISNGADVRVNSNSGTMARGRALNIVE